MKVDKDKVLIGRARNCQSVSDLLDAGVTKGNLNSISSGKSMKPETVGRIAKALKVDVTEILATK